MGAAAAARALATCAASLAVSHLREGTTRGELACFVLVFSAALYVASSCLCGAAFCLAGKTVVVTGGEGGLGRALRARFAAAGARVASWDVVQGAEEGSTAVDVTVPGAQRRAAAALGRPIDVFVCNAGAAACARVADMSSAALRTTLEVNVGGVLRGVEEAGGCFAADARVVVVSSATAGCGTVAGLSEYCASKFALTACAAALSGSVLVVSPGFMATPMFEDVSFTALQRLVTPPLAPRDVADEVVRAVEAGVTGNLLLPRVMYAVRLAAVLLPARVVDALAGFYGVHTAADCIVRR